MTAKDGRGQRAVSGVDDGDSKRCELEWLLCSCSSGKSVGGWEWECCRLRLSRLQVDGK